MVSARDPGLALPGTGQNLRKHHALAQGTEVVRELANEVDWVFFGMCPDKLRPYVHEFHQGIAFEHYPAALARMNLDLALAPVALCPLGGYPGDED